MSGRSAEESQSNPRNQDETLAPLEIYECGPVIVVGFGNQQVPDDLCLSEYHDRLGKLIREHSCQDLALDLTDVKYIPSGLLGLLVSLKRNFEVGIQLYNPSPDVRETLEITKLDGQFSIRTVPIK